MPPKKKPTFNVKPPESSKYSVPIAMNRGRFRNTAVDRKKFQKEIAEQWEKEIATLQKKLKTGGLRGGPAVDGAKYNINLGIKDATKQLKYIKSTKYLDFLERNKVGAKYKK